MTVKPAFTVLLGVVCLGTATIGQAQPGVVDVVAPPSLENWSTTVFSNLQRRLRYPEPFGPGSPSEGIVAVKFNCSESGAPADVSLYKTSGHPDLDAATVRAVRHIATLHPLPRGVSHDQQYVVRVLFSTSVERGRAKLAQMRKDAEHNNAWFGRTGMNTASLELLPSGA